MRITKRGDGGDRQASSRLATHLVLEGAIEIPLPFLSRRNTKGVVPRMPQWSDAS